MLLRLFLGRVCLDNFCEDDEGLVCYSAERFEIAAGECGDVLELGAEELELIDVDDLPDLSLPPPDSVLGDGGLRDAGDDAAADAGGDAGCVGNECPCADAESCASGSSPGGAV